MRRRRVLSAVITALTVAATAAAAQDGPRAGSVAPGLVVGGAGMTPIVGDLEEAVRFYADLVGLDAPPPGS